MNALERLIADNRAAWLKQCATAEAGRPCPQGQAPRPRKARRAQPAPAGGVPPRLTLPEPEPVDVDWDTAQAIKKLQASLKRQQNAPQVFRFPFAIGEGAGQPKTTAEYVAEFCALNNLIHERSTT